MASLAASRRLRGELWRTCANALTTIASPEFSFTRSCSSSSSSSSFPTHANALTSRTSMSARRGLSSAAGGEPGNDSKTKIDWREAMDSGNWDAAWASFESESLALSLDVPQLEDVLDWDPDDEEKQIRRRKELEYQDQQAKSRVRTVNEQGIAHGVGKRKTAVSRVWLREGNGHVMVNKKPFDVYFPDMLRRNDVLTPLVVADALGKFDVAAIVQGGGVMAQAQATRHGIAKALQNWEPELRGVLKDHGLLSRDARIVERKKPGRFKARKGFPWVKR